MKTKVAPRSKARASTLKKVGKKVARNAGRAAAKPSARKASAVLATSKPAPKSAIKSTAKPAIKSPIKAKAPAHLNGSAGNTKSTDLPIIYVNGKMVPKSQATVSVYDHGLLYGDGIFEGIRIYKGKIFKCKQHMERLYHCAEQIRLTIPVPMEEMVRIQRRCIEVNKLDEGYIRLVVTRGFGTLGLDPRRCPTAGVICIADQIRLFPVEQYETGMRVIVANRPKTPIVCLDPRVKSLNYLNNILAKVEAIDFGCDECIMLNLDGYVTEGSGDNIFAIKNGTLYTPPSDAGILEPVCRVLWSGR